MNQQLRPNRSAVWPLLVAVAAVVPVLYLLSVGPVYGLYFNGTISEDTMLTFDEFVYAPLWWLGTQCPAFGEPLSAYVGWFFQRSRQ